MQQPQAKVGKVFALQPFELLGGGAGLDLLRPFDQRTHDEPLSPFADLCAQPLVRRRPFQRTGTEDPRLDGDAAFGHLPQLGLVEIAVDEHRRGSGDRRRRHD